jgi:NADP-dependent 3-hydroxy acid dehydrogenase YdfG
MNKQRVVLITGATSGIGHVIAESFVQQGWRVFGTSRHLDRIIPFTGIE